jgi:hypothetical protein
MRTSRIGSALAMAAMAIGLMSPQAAPPVQKQAARSESPRVTPNQKRRTLRSYFGDPMMYARSVTTTRTTAQQKRQARKARNVKRNKR